MNLIDAAPCRGWPLSEPYMVDLPKPEKPKGRGRHGGFDGLHPLRRRAIEKISNSVLFSHLELFSRWTLAPVLACGGEGTVNGHCYN